MHSFLQNNIAAVLYEQRKLAEAMELYQEVLRVRVAALGPEHPHVAGTKVRREMSGLYEFSACFHSNDDVHAKASLCSDEHRLRPLCAEETYPGTTDV